MKTPSTLDEAVALLDRLTTGPTREKTQTAASPDDLFPGWHHTMGMTLRNEWGLWTGSPLARWFAERGITHADDMSGIIFDATIAAVRGEVFDFDAQVKRYQAHWKKTMGVEIPPAPWLEKEQA